MFKFFRYASFIVFLSCFLVAWNLESMAWGQTIHVILATDGADVSIGNAVETDRDNMANLFRANVPATNLNLITLEADTMTPDGILQSVENLNIAPNDSIVFYFSGHGAFDVNGEKQFLTLIKGGNLYRETLLKKIEEKKTRLAVLLTDCCNNEINTVAGTRTADSTTYSIQTPGSFSPLFENLFVFCKGTVDLTSSKPGEYSFVIDVKEGSIFTKALIDVANRNKTNSDMYWAEFYNGLFRESGVIFSKKFPKGAKGNVGGLQFEQHTQTVHKYHLPGTDSMQNNSIQPLEREGPRLGLRAVNHDGTGVRTTAIAPNSPASRADIVVGDIITAINGGAVTNETSYSDAVDQSPKTMTLTLKKEDGSNKNVTIELKW